MISFYCASCGQRHALPQSDEAFREARRLFDKVIEHRTIAIFGEGRASMSLCALNEPGKGKMVGTLHFRNPATGREGFLYGFSGQFDDAFHLHGYVPAIIDYELMGAHKRATEAMLDALGVDIEQRAEEKAKRALKERRKSISQALMRDIFSLYRPRNRRRRSMKLKEAWSASSGIPAATGDCCAPKLIQQANLLDLEILGIAEIFVGSPRRNSEQRHGAFSEPCTPKCAPLLGAMLCEQA